MENNKFDFLIPEISSDIMEYFFISLQNYPVLQGNIDTAPLLNMTLGVFISAMVNILDRIKRTTEGEIKLINNIELAKNTIMKAVEDLPFVKSVQVMK